MTEPAAVPTRRDRMRAATREEIIQTARRLLVRQGPEAASLRAIAREMGMTAPGLYRYFSSREELLRHMVAEIFRELSRDIRQAIDQSALPGGDTRTQLTLGLVAACREFRRWALSNKEEFGMLFGVPLPQPGLEHREDPYDIAEQCAMEFAGTFFALFRELWNKQRFPVPADTDIDARLLPQLREFAGKLRSDLPDGAVLVFLRCWVLFYGALAMEVFGHLAFALDDPSPMFEITLSELASRVGLEYPLPEAHSQHR